VFGGNVEVVGVDLAGGEEATKKKNESALGRDGSLSLFFAISLLPFLPTSFLHPKMKPKQPKPTTKVPLISLSNLSASAPFPTPPPPAPPPPPPPIAFCAPALLTPA